MNIQKKFAFMMISMMGIIFSSCDNTRSYSDLLKEEQKVSNWFLAQHRVCNEMPSDSVFETGPNAPYYKMDPDGYVYMQVVTPGDKDIPEAGDQVYFTFTRYNIQTMYANNSLKVEGTGNQDDFLNSVGQSYFIFGNYYVTSSAQFGQGIQWPVSYLGYNSEVNILLKSYYGFQSEQTTCVPYLVNTRYFKAEY